MGLCVGKAKRGKGTKWMVVGDGKGIPLVNYLDSATPAEVTLIEPLFCKIAGWARLAAVQAPVGNRTHFYLDWQFSKIDRAL